MMTKVDLKQAKETYEKLDPEYRNLVDAVLWLSMSEKSRKHYKKKMIASEEEEIPIID